MLERARIRNVGKRDTVDQWPDPVEYLLAPLMHGLLLGLRETRDDE